MQFSSDMFVFSKNNTTFSVFLFHIGFKLVKPCRHYVRRQAFFLETHWKSYLSMCAPLKYQGLLFFLIISGSYFSSFIFAQHKIVFHCFEVFLAEQWLFFNAKVFIGKAAQTTWGMCFG